MATIPLAKVFALLTSLEERLTRKYHFGYALCHTTHFFTYLVQSNPVKSNRELALPWDSLPLVNRTLRNPKNTLSIDKKISCLQYSQKWSLEEIKALIEEHEEYGSKWPIISQKHFPLRTAAALQCKWYRLTGTISEIDNKMKLNAKKWKSEEDKELYSAVKRYKKNNRVDWKGILSTGYFPGRSTEDLWRRYHNVLAQPKRGSWNKQEDEKLLSLVQSHGKKWTEISHILQRPSSAICGHYEEVLAPGIKRGRWTDEEFNKLAKAFQNNVENWEQIQLLIPGRSLDQIKKHYHHSPKVQTYYNSGKWNSVEVKSLIHAFEKHEKNWEKISEAVNTRNSKQCYKKIWEILRDSKYKRFTAMS
ncbi:hypothetical protein G9A89_015056 [Geosiphon pyriformis]|nr:hypothetical protein G9A89_015056 [Geosiphon pyriformis]